MTDVAHRAGVSRGTVSNVLNAPHVVRPAVRDRVLSAIAQLGYVRNESARTLAAGSSRVIGVVLADLGNSLFVDIARGAEAEGTARGMKVVIADSATDGQRQREALDLFRELRAAGVILTPLDPVDERLGSDAWSGDLSLVLADHTHPRWNGSSVTTDERLGGYLAGHHLLELGRRRLIFAGGSGEVAAVRARRDGALAAVAEAPDAKLRILSARGLEIPDGRLVAQEALRSGEPFDAIFAASDLMAVGCVEVLRGAGLRVPDDVAIVGYDDNHFASEAAIPISTIAKHGRQMGGEAMKLLLDALGQQEAHAQRIVLKPQLVARQSTLGPALVPTAP